MAREWVPGAVIGQKYRSAVASFRRQLSDNSLRLSFEQEADAFFRRAALGVWAHGSGITENHVEAYNAICSGANAPARTLYMELSALVSMAPAFQAPGFYSQLVASDRGTGRKRAAQFCDMCSILLLLFATAEAPILPEMTDYADDCVAQLRAMAGGSPVGRPAAPKSPSAGTAEAPEAEAADAARPEAEAAPEEPQPSLEELMAELDSLCGLEKVKKDVRSLVNLVKIRKLREEQELPTPAMSLHLVFMGNPGTGKTTVARLLAGIYRAIGVLPKGQLIEVDRSGLVAGYVGQTAIQTQKVIQSALGGVLFIDEAYALASQPGTNDFGQEAIDTLLKGMEDHRKELIVIVAGYSNLMMNFIHSNPGLESRFNKYIYFDDYKGPELNEIFHSICKKNGYTVAEDLDQKLPDFFRELYEDRDENFGNARDVRNLFENLVTIQSNRVALMDSPTRDDLMAITLADFETAKREECGDTEEEKAPELTLTPAEDTPAPAESPAEPAESPAEPNPEN